jgi:hypothetical protein
MTMVGLGVPKWLTRAYWIGWRGELGWALIGLETLAPCALCGILSYAGMPVQDATPDMLAQLGCRSRFLRARSWRGFYPTIITCQVAARA